ncbi:MAG: tetratricopeptide repeat protein [Spirochaetaceae bacterium]|nr:tetratricopeptide repeat protein [Spirochaetaceae bacterium]
MKAGEYYNSGDYAGAITAYSEAITRGSTNLDAYWFRGFAYIQTKHYDAAIADFDTVINRNPTFAVGYIARGDAYGAKGAYLSAIADYKTGLEKGYDPSGFSVDKSSKADMWFCGAMFIEITVNRFLGKSDVVAKYEGWLKTAGDKNKVTRAEVETFYRQNIGGLISTAVDEEFNKISFLLENSKTNPVRDHISVLTRDPKTGQYTLSYRGVYTNEKIRTIKGNTLEALSSEMRNGQYKSDFDETGIQAVRARAALIPAVVLSGAALSEAKNILVNFYTNPSQATYNALKDMNVVYRDTNINFGDIKYTYVEESCKSAFSALNHDLRQKIVRDSLQQTRYTVISKAQADRLVQLR